MSGLVISASLPTSPFNYVFATPAVRAPFNLHRAVRDVADFAGVSVDDVLKGRRHADVVRVRWAVMRAMKRGRGLSSTQIGNRIGRDHTTVLNGLKRADALYASDADFARLADFAMRAFV